MINKQNILLKEISFEEYQQINRKQKIKPPRKEEFRTIYAKILNEINYSARNLAREIKENLNDFKKINSLYAKKEGSGKIFLKRKKLDFESEEITSGFSKLEELIKNGRGIDIIFKGKGSGTNNNCEKHYYRIIGEKVVLVELQIPYHILKEGGYKLIRTTGKEYSRLKATHIMSNQEIKKEFFKRRNFN